MYSTSKYGVVGLTETLRIELRDTAVGTSVLCPAAVTTRILDSERNRPAALARPTPLPPHTPSSVFDLSPPLEPGEIGDLVLEGIRRNQLYIFTDPKTRPLIESRHRRMLDDFDHLEEWLAAARSGRLQA